MNENKILFSIVVPFYETIDYIKETIDSIVNQQFIDLDTIEVIVVNDGSKYNVRQILDCYKDKLSNLSIYDKENGNWGSVVNYVKRKRLAHGKYITILDSDDKFALNTLSIFSQYIKNDPDIITSDFYRWSPKQNKKHKIFVHWLPKTKFFNSSKYLKKKHIARSAYSFPICKFYKTQMFYDADLLLVEKMPYQDIFLYHKMVDDAKSWQYIHKCLGYYRSDRPDSTSNIEWSATRIKNWIKVINHLNAIGSTCNAYMYCIYTPFKKACKLHQTELANEEITLQKKFKIAYIWKPLHPFAKILFKLVTWKMTKYIKINFA